MRLFDAEFDAALDARALSGNSGRATCSLVRRSTNGAGAPVQPGRAPCTSSMVASIGAR
jgi:hypothetical protein